jgi:MFS family permease
LGGNIEDMHPSTKPKVFYGYIVVAVALFITAIAFGPYFAFGVFFKPVLTEFGWTRAMTSGAFSLAMIVQGLISVVMGGLNDRLGPRIVLTCGGILLGIGYLLMSLIGAVWQLYLFYVVIIGLSLSSTLVPLVSTVARWFVKRRGIMTGIVISGSGIGILITPPIANWLIATYDWRITYIILGIVVLIIITLAAQFLKSDPVQMGLTPYGKNKVDEQRLELVAEGFSVKQAIYTSRFWLVIGMSFCLGFSRLTLLVHIVPHAIDLGITAATAASILATIGGTQIVGQIVLGIVADRIGNKQVYVIGFILMLAALFWLAPAREMWMLYLFATVFGFAHAGIGSAESPLIAVLFGLRSHGLLLGIVRLSVTFGGAIGPLLAGYIFDVTESYKLAFMVCAVVVIVGLILTIVLKPITNKQNQSLEIT